MGSTFTWIFQEQLDRLQEGDRLYYFNQLKDEPLILADINSQHFSDIVARNTGLDHLHYAIFKVAERADLDPHEHSRDMSATPVVPDKVLTIVGNALPNVITGTPGDDTIYGEDGNDTIYGGLGLDALHGGKGNDLLEAGGSTRGVFAYGEDGNDVLRGNAGDDNLIGGPGNDILHGASGKDFMSGGDGDDLLFAGPDPDLIDGGAGNDTVDFSESSAGVSVDLRITLTPVPGLGGYAQGDLLNDIENVVGTKFADTLTGDAGDNRLEGGEGDDLLDGGGGTDRLIGGAGNDTYVIDQAGDVIVEFGNGGKDTVHVAVGASYALTGNVENVIYTGDYAGIAQFAMEGSGGANSLTGGSGVDVLNGRGGDDILTGGGGNDRFVFAPGFGQDRIEDFDANPAGGQDIIDLTAFDITADEFAGRVAIADVGADTLVTIDADPQQTILLAGIGNAAAITQQDFVL
jgi:Ca2+-binding RTX toxin-like protein